jgi:hypothetical protein
MMATLHSAETVLDIVRFDRLSPGPQPLTLARVMREGILTAAEARAGLAYMIETGRITREDVTI